jgi:hypothetical protein
MRLRISALSLLTLALLAITADAQTISLGLREQRNRLRNESGLTSLDFDTNIVEAEVGIPSLNAGRATIEPLLRIGGGHADTRIDVPILQERRLTVFDGRTNVRTAGIGVFIDPCNDCGWSVRADYDYERVRDREQQFALTRRELSAGVGRELFDGRAMASLGARRIDFDGSEADFISRRIKHAHVEPYAGISLNLGRGFSLNTRLGLYNGRLERTVSIRWTFSVAPPAKPPEQPGPGAPLDLSGVVLKNGMLAFDDQSTFDRTLTQVTSDKAAEEIEQRLSHQSLRQDLVRRQEQLATAGRLDQYNDPDNHFVQDRALRTLLNARGELQIGSSIYALVDSDTTIEVPASRTDLLERTRAGTSTAVLADAGAVIHGTDNNSPLASCKADFSVTPLGQNAFSFTNTSLGTAPIMYYWDFDDGTDSQDKDPTHTYAAAGQHHVCLTIHTADGCVVTECRWVTSQNCSSHFTSSVKDTTATFTAGALTSGYTLLWEFGDGTTSTDTNPTHDYKTVGDRFVCLTITSPGGGCTDKYCDWVRIKQQNDDCCDANDKVLDKWTYYAKDTRRFKSVLWQKNLPFYHRWGARTVNYAKNSNGHWRKADADRVKVSGGGTIYTVGADGSRCASPHVTSDYDDPTNEDTAEIWRGTSVKFWTKKNSLASLHSVRYNGQTIDGPTLFLSNDCAVKICKETCVQKADVCKDVCTQEADECKDVCTAGRNVCKQSCSGGWLKKLFCKLNCWWESGSCKRDCRKGKRVCKRECRKGKRECKRDCR